jgi:AraC-like DNA-binding protein
MLLQSYPELRTRDLDVIGAALKLNGFGSRAETSVVRSRAEFIANVANFKEVGLAFVSHDSPITFEVNPSSDILIGYQLRGVSEVLVDGDVVENGVLQPGCLIPNERSWCVEAPNGYQVLMLRVAADTLRRKLSALLGVDRVRLDLRQPCSAGPTRALLRETVITFAKELDRVDQRFLPLLVVHSTDEICRGILTSLNEQVLEAERSPAAPSAVQLGRVEEYIFANYARPLTIETLAEISGVSGRSVLRHFLSRYGCTPHDYLEGVRLEMARARLPSHRDKGSAGAVALRCGFPSLSHFMRAYRNRYGELPLPMFGGAQAIQVPRREAVTGPRR